MWITRWNDDGWRAGPRAGRQRGICALAPRQFEVHNPRPVRPIYEAESLVDAQLLVDLLEHHGIGTVVKNAHLQGALGELPLTLKPVVCVVRDKDWAEAVVLGGEFVAAMERPIGPSRRCAPCGEESPGNFSVCWKCREPFPEAS